MVATSPADSHPFSEILALSRHIMQVDSFVQLIIVEIPLAERYSRPK